jgi:thymidine phosphorylase
VESIPLITASILSKKLAAGLGHLVLDVKTGSGAFMATMEEARGLAESLVAVANGAGLPTTALITDMDEPLAPCAGNALEVAHAAEFLLNRRAEPRVMDITLALGAELLLSAGIAPDEKAARAKLHQTLGTGRAAEHFDRMVAALGGPKDFLANHQKYLVATPIVRPVHAGRDGFISAIRTRELGLAVIELGGGRRVASDKIDHRVGLSGLLGKGARVERSTPLCLVHAADEAGYAKAAAMVNSAYAVGEQPAVSANVLARVTA